MERKCEFIASIPGGTGRVIGMALYEGKLILATELGNVYVVHPDTKEVQKVEPVGNPA